MASRRTNQRGLALISFAMSLLILVPLIGVGVDTAMLYLVKERLSSAVQLSARSAARSADPADAAKRYFDANFPDGFLGVTARTVAYKNGELSASVEAPTYFMRILHYPSVTVTANVHH